MAAQSFTDGSRELTVGLLADRSDQDPESSFGSMARRLALHVGCDAAGFRIQRLGGGCVYFGRHGFDDRFVSAEAGKRGAGSRGSGTFFGPDLADRSSWRGQPPPELVDLWRAFEYQSAALVPLESGDRVYGMLHAAGKDKGRLGEPAMSMFGAVGPLLGWLVATARLDALRRRLHSSAWSAETESLLVEFGSVVAHKLKSPAAGLALVSTRLRRAGERAGDEALTGMADQVMGMANRLSTELDKILAPLVGSVPDMSRIDVLDVMEDAAELSNWSCGRDWVALGPLRDDPLPPARGNAGFLLHAISVVLANAGASPAARARLQAASRPGEEQEVEIRICLPGLESDYRSDALLRPGGTAPGFPLGIVARMMERIRGKASVAPADGGGVQVSLLLQRWQREAAGTPGCMEPGKA